jgi:hypothetical protein
MRSSLSALQTALYNRLIADLTLMSKVTGVFDDVPDKQPYPYVTLGEDTVTDWGTKTFSGEEVTHTLHVWSRGKGKKESQEILSLILEVITREPLLISDGFSVEFSQLDYMQVFVENDGLTRHGVLRLRFKIKQ